MRIIFVIFNLIIVLVFASCNYFAKSVESTIDSQINNSIDAFEKIQSLQKDSLANIYGHLLAFSTDSTEYANVKKLNLSILQTITYIDSLIVVMKNMDYKNIYNVELVKSFFFYKGFGDSLFKKLSSTFSTAELIAEDHQAKVKIRNTQVQLLIYDDVDKFKSAYFESTGSVASALILYDFKSAVLRIGIDILGAIKT